MKTTKEERKQFANNWGKGGFIHKIVDDINTLEGAQKDLQDESDYYFVRFKTLKAQKALMLEGLALYANPNYIGHKESIDAQRVIDKVKEMDSEI